MRQPLVNGGVDDVDLIEAFDFPELLRVAQLDQRESFRQVIVKGAFEDQGIGGKESAPVPSPRWASEKTTNRESGALKRFIVLISRCIIVTFSFSFPRWSVGTRIYFTQ